MPVIRRPRPKGCRHTRLQDCPLTVNDWNMVMIAWLGFKQQCALIAEEAHRRADQDHPTRERTR